MIGRDNYILNNCKNLYGFVKQNFGSNNGGLILFFIIIIKNNNLINLFQKIIEEKKNIRFWSPPARQTS